MRETIAQLEALSSQINKQDPLVAMILAAGHGKRIRSEKSKMLHNIWGIPTVTRVANAARDGLGTSNQIIVVGIKAVEVAQALGKNEHRVFVYQPEQRGTGDAVRVGLHALAVADYDGAIFVFPGDMGLLNREAVRGFRDDFEKYPCDMIVLTAEYQGNVEQNYYGRIIRVPERDTEGRSSGDDFGKVIEIKEHRDILAMPPDKSYQVQYNRRLYNFTREELLNLREFNTGVYAFKSGPLMHFIETLQPDNVQEELYITDLIAIFNKNGLTVRAARAKDPNTVLGFNNKSVLKEMEKIARENAYAQLKDIIMIEDKDDFFIADEVIEQILELDKTHAPLDIEIGKGVSIGPGVKLNKGVVIKKRAVLDGNIVLGENVKIHENVSLSTYPHQTLRIGRNSEILQGDIVKGNLTIGENCRIESSVNMTGSDEFPIRIGNNVLIKGTSYIFGSIIEDDIWIEHSVLKYKYVERTVRKDGSVQPIKWVLPAPEGLDSIHSLEKK
ncbi:MAG: NTP transferase domain-containing protein [candidate division KSB1 bacterium]|nr:NTP transferase domain-containing protein [candidate division KSB1 bacterium]MDZ7311924.1 NTP transferase domain-containing protein [candidate division KSB1 bacterium]